VATMPTDPFTQGTPGEQMVEDGRLLIEQVLRMSSGDEVANAVFALNEEDLRAIAMLLVADLHPAIPVALRAEGGQRHAD
jgi:hypothetical protein